MSGKLKTSGCVTAIGCLVFLFVLAPAARSADKTTWSKFDNSIPDDSNTISTNGRIPLGETGGRGDINDVRSPSVIKDGYFYKMWYGGKDASSKWRIYHATLDALPKGTIISIH